MAFWRIALALCCGLLAACATQASVAPTLTPTSAPTATPTLAPTATPLPGRPVAVPGGVYINLSPAQLAAMLERKDFLLINTHAPYEVEIAGTDAHIPLDQGGMWLRHYPADKTAKIIVYCRSAQWSSLAARDLVKAGYSNVWHLEGGMVAWAKAGLPLKGK